MPEFVKYFLNSLLGLCVDYIAVVIALACGIPYQAALFIGLALGGITGFLLMTFWVFPTQKNAFSGMRIVSYLLGLGIIYGVRAAYMYGWYQLQFSPQWDYIALLGAYGLSFIINFAFQRFFYTKY